MNPRLTAEKAAWLVAMLSRVRDDGRVEMVLRPVAPGAVPVLYRIDDQMACWRAVEAPVLMVLADDGFVHERFGKDPAERERRLGCFRNRQLVTIADCSHNRSIDQPEAVAGALEAFLTRTDRRRRPNEANETNEANDCPPAA